MLREYKSIVHLLRAPSYTGEYLKQQNAEFGVVSEIIYSAHAHNIGKHHPVQNCGSLMCF